MVPYICLLVESSLMKGIVLDISNNNSVLLHVVFRYMRPKYSRCKWCDAKYLILTWLREGADMLCCGKRSETEYIVSPKTGWNIIYQCYKLNYPSNSCKI